MIDLSGLEDHTSSYRRNWLASVGMRHFTRPRHMANYPGDSYPTQYDVSVMHLVYCLTKIFFPTRQYHLQPKLDSFIHLVVRRCFPIGSSLEVLSVSECSERMVWDHGTEVCTFRCFASGATFSLLVS